MKQKLSTLLLLLLIGTTSTSWAQTFSGGEGTDGDPYQITNAAQLNAVREKLDAHYILMSDIDLDGIANWQPIGDYDTRFTGTFDGNGHTISNMTINSGSYIGLFGVIGSGAKVKDLGIVDCNVTGTNAVGGLAGRSQGDINNCYAKGTVIGKGIAVGGLVGYNISSINNCYATGTVKGTGNQIGGLVGSNIGSINNCYATATVSGGEIVGGLVGANDGSINNCYATGNASGNNDVGGLVGNNNMDITNCYATGAVKGEGNRVGGLVGYNYGKINNCYAAGKVSGNNMVGGLIGNNNKDITNCYATGNVSGSNNVGGLIGNNNRYNSMDINNCYANPYNGNIYIGAGYGNDDVSHIDDILGAIGNTWDADSWAVSDNNYPYLKTVTNYQIIITGDISKTINVNHGIIANMPTIPTQPPGYKITFSTEYDFIAPLTADVTLTATLTGKEYTITLKGNGGTVNGSDEETHNVTYNEEVGTLTNATRTGYTFNGWYTATTNGTEYTATTIYNVVGDIALYAQWTINQYTVTFETNGGSAVAPMTGIAHGSPIDAPTAPTRTGYTFAGWFEAATGGTAIGFPLAVTSGATLYAQWTVIPPTPEPTPPPIPVRSVTINQSELDMILNQTVSLSISFQPAQATNKSVTWSSSDESVATVNSIGQVTAHTKGTATITVTTQSGRHTATCEVTVTSPVSNSSIVGNAFKVYPNPTTGPITATGLTVGTTIKVYAITGALVATYTANAEKMIIDLSSLPAGIYLLSANSRTIKVVKK